LIVGSKLWTDYVTVTESDTLLAKIPSSIPPNEAALIPSYLSAWAILSETPLPAGSLVLQTHGGSALGSALAEVGKALQLNVVSLSDEDLASTSSEYKGKAQLLVTPYSGKKQLALIKLGAKDSTLVVYNGPIIPVTEVEDLKISLTSTIFNGISIRGFDFTTWATSDKERFAAGVTIITELLSAKKLSSKAKLFPQAEYLKAIEAVQATGVAAVLN